MQTSTLSTILRQLDEEVDRLLQARHLLTGVTESAKPHAYAQIHPVTSGGTITVMPGQISHPPASLPRTRRPHTISPAGRKKMAAAQRRRWKKFHQEQKQAQRTEKTLQKKSA